MGMSIPEASLQEKHCLLCSISINRQRKYCGEKNYESTCATCGQVFRQKCQKRTTAFCGKSCQNKNPAVVEKANASREALGYLEDNARASMAKAKEKYGVDNISQLETVKAKKAQRPQGFADPAVRAKIEAGLMERYGVKNGSQLEEVKELKKAKALEKYGVTCVLLAPENRAKALKNKRNIISNTNRVFQQELKQKLGVEFSFEKPLNKQKNADLGYDDLRIEINPTISHNSSISYVHGAYICLAPDCKKQDHIPLAQNYHQERLLIAEHEGLRLMQYFDWYNKDSFISMVAIALGQTPKEIKADDTQLREISERTLNEFLRRNHYLGEAKGNEYSLGLFLEDELVFVQSYGQNKSLLDNTWDIIASTNKNYTQVIGGFKKCSEYFLNKIKPSSLTYHEDLTIASGLAQALPPEWSCEGITNPRAMWVKYLTNEKNASYPSFISDSSLQASSVERILGFSSREDEEGKKISNDTVMVAEGFVKVYDCGAKVYKYTASVQGEKGLGVTPGSLKTRKIGR